MELTGHEQNADFYKEHFISAEPLKAGLFELCSEYYFSKSNMRHQYQLPSGVVTIKQTRHEPSACASCRRYFVSSRGKIWYCRPNNVITDTRAEKMLNLPEKLESQLNFADKKEMTIRLRFGCDRAVD